MPRAWGSGRSRPGGRQASVRFVGADFLHRVVGVQTVEAGATFETRFRSWPDLPPRTSVFNAAGAGSFAIASISASWRFMPSSIAGVVGVPTRAELGAWYCSALGWKEGILAAECPVPGRALTWRRPAKRRQESGKTSARMNFLPDDGPGVGSRCQVLAAGNRRGHRRLTITRSPSTTGAEPVDQGVGWTGAATARGSGRSRRRAR